VTRTVEETNSYSVSAENPERDGSEDLNKNGKIILKCI
jgi:hypothetical protein